MNHKSIITSILFAGILVSPLQALDIPLSGSVDTGRGGGASLGYVDMDRIFKIFPQTQAAKEDYAKQLKKKRDQLAAKEAEMADVKGRIAVLESTLKQSTDAQSTSAAPDASSNNTASASQSLGKMKQELETHKTELEELSKQATSDLAAFESQQSQLILGKIYQALRDVAIEAQVSVVVDKSSILYGDATIDLTEKLQERVRGY